MSEVFDYTDVCWSCGRKTFINKYGFCEKCWVTHTHISEGEN